MSAGPSAPVVGDLAFLDQEPVTPRTPGRHGSAVEELRAAKQQRRRKVLLVWSLCAVLVSLAVLAVLVNLLVGRPGPPPAEKAEMQLAQTSTKPKPKQPEAVIGLDEKALKSLELPGSKPVVSEGERATKATAEPEGAKWIDAKTGSASAGDVEVKIQSVAIGNPRWLVTPGSAKSQQFLIVIVQLRNLTEERIVNHAGWIPRTPAAMGVKLADEHKNSYALKASAVGRTGPESIYPKKSLDDKLVFQEPVESAKLLRLELPAAAFGGRGTLRFQIPREMITELAEEPQSCLLYTSPSPRDS